MRRTIPYFFASLCVLLVCNTACFRRPAENRNLFAIEEESGSETQARSTSLLPSRSGFSGNGVVTSTIGNDEDVVRAITYSSSTGAFYFAGRTKNSAAQNNMLVGKISAAGILDTTFGTSGTSVLDFGSNRDEVAHSVSLQTDGKIVIAGRAYNGTNYDFAIARYLTTGSIDSAFASSGFISHTIGSGNEFIRGVFAQTDGKIVAAGYSNGSNYDFAVAKYEATGALDTSFGTAGTVQHDLSVGNDDCATAVALTTNGKIIAVGATYNASNNWDIAIARYHTNGSADTAFGTSSVVTTTIGGGDDVLWAVAMPSGGKIIGAGQSNNGSSADFLAVRYSASGALDTTFNSTGFATQSIGSGDDIAKGVAILNNDNIFLAGETNNGSNKDFALVRLNTDGSRDITLNGKGVALQTMGSSNEVGLSVAAADPYAIVAGWSSGATTDLAFHKLENYVTTRLWGAVDAARANNGDSAYPNGCTGTDLNWKDISLVPDTVSLNGFANCATIGWQGDGSTTSPYHIAFNGTGADEWVAFSNTIYLEYLTYQDAMSLEVWANLNSLPTGSGSANDAYHALLMKEGMHLGIHIDTTGAVNHTQWYADSHGEGVASNTKLNTGTWYHLVTTSSETDARLRVYINGALDNSHAVTGDPNGGYSSNLWRLGIAAPGASTYRWAADAKIAVARLYAIELTPAQVSQNCKALQGRFSGVNCN